MPAYAYSGIDGRGRQVKGVQSADNVAALRAALKKQGVYLTSVAETKAVADAGSTGREVDLSRLFDRVTPKMVSRMTRLLGTLLRSGVTLPESLAALVEQTESQRFAGILGDIRERVNEGSSLADAMAAHDRVFPPLYVNMIRAGEASGALERVLDRLADFLERQQELRGKVASAMMYPVVLAILGASIVTILMIQLVPKITAMFEEMSAELPWNTRLLIFISDVLSDYWYLVLAALGIATFAFRRWKRTEEGRARFDRFVLSLPVFGDLARKVAVTRFARTLATLLQSGVQLLGALEIVENLLGNVHLATAVRRARDDIREGEGIAPALRRTGEFPSLVLHMIAVGERSGQLEAMLEDVANAYEREVNTAIDRMTTLLEPLMIVGMGISVGFVMFSIMQPIMMLNSMAGT
ncbi:MAG: type II secretion system protein GspF [Deltaproteobacteria bacterium]|nr:MAG: type II secretion system protein GspF [Deltaproteobacteria bacterium]